MLKYTLPPLRPELGVCPTSSCGASGRIGVHSHTDRRYICHACGKTFAETAGTPLYGLQHPTWLVVVVLTVLAGGCPLPAIVFAFGLDERTVAEWQRTAGQHAKAVQKQRVCRGQLELGQVQGDEVYVKTQHGTVWMATAMSVFSRLFLWGAVAPQRDTSLITQVVQHVRAAAQIGQPIWWAVDGFSAWRRAILNVFREPVRTGKRAAAAGSLDRVAQCAGGQTGHWAAADLRPAPIGPWLPALRRGDPAGDSGRRGRVQHGLWGATQRDVSDVAARPDTAQPHPCAPGGAIGSRDVLDGCGLHFLSHASDPHWHTRDGGRPDRPCLVRGRIPAMSAQA
jgi:transposase-like protein